MRIVRRLAPMLTLALALTTGPIASACPNCKDAVAADDAMAVKEGRPTSFMKNGYNYSVLLMMAMPFTLLGTGAWMVSRAIKKGALPEF